MRKASEKAKTSREGVWRCEVCGGQLFVPAPVDGCVVCDLLVGMREQHAVYI